MQTMNATTEIMGQMPQTTDFCQLDIFADEDLSFNVRVSCGGRHYVAGGFLNPDDAQRQGLRALLAMSGMPLEDDEDAEDAESMHECA